MRFEPYFAIEEIIVDCANRINRIANCSNNLRWDKVLDLRVSIRKFQAESLQLSSLFRKAGEMDADTKRTQEVQEKVQELERENSSLKKCIKELKEQMQVVREMYTNEDFEDRKKMRRMEKEISALREERERMKMEMEETRAGKNKEDLLIKKEQNRGKVRTIKTIDDRGKIAEKIHPSSPTPGPSGITRNTGKARGPAEKYERDSEEEIRMGK